MNDDTGAGAGAGDRLKELKEAAYAAVGLGVLGVQRLQVRRRDVTKQVEPQVREAAQRLQHLASAADEALNPVLERIESRLPEATRDLVHSAHSVVIDARDTVLDKAARPR